MGYALMGNVPRSGKSPLFSSSNTIDITILAHRCYKSNLSIGADNAATLTNGPRSSMGMGRTRTLSIINVPPLCFIPRISHWQG